MFSVSSAIGFLVGAGLFGAVTFLPLYLQTVRGHSPTTSGLLMTPMMAGLLITSIASGQAISRIGRYKRFPIAGTAIMAVGFVLLSRLEVDTSAVVSGAYMLVLGLGMGLVMQVLVLAVQNAVDYRDLGVATAGTTMFRQMGGAIGTAAFGAIFSSQAAANLAGSLPAGAQLPEQTDPTAVERLAPAVRAAYRAAVTAALEPVFLTGAGLALLAFALTWLLREVPLRTTTQAPHYSARASRAPATTTRTAGSNVRCPGSPAVRSGGRSTSARRSAPRSTCRRRSCGCSHASASACRSPRRSSKRSWRSTLSRCRQRSSSCAGRRS